MRGKKTRLTEKTAVIKAKLQDPEASLRDITKRTGVNHVTSQNIIKSIPEELTSSNIGAQMIGKLDDIVNDIVDLTKENLKKYKGIPLGPKDLKAISEIGKINRERKQILEGKPTEHKIIDFDLSSKSIKELEEFRKNLLGNNK